MTYKHTMTVDEIARAAVKLLRANATTLARKRQSRQDYSVSTDAPERNSTHMADASARRSRTNSPKRKRPHVAYVWRTSGRWRYQVRAGNGRVVGKSEQGFRSLQYCEERILDQFSPCIIRLGHPDGRPTWSARSSR